MKLHESIKYLLDKKNVPLTFDEIAKEINEENLYIREDFKKLTGSQIRLRVLRYSELFHNINGYVILTSNLKWSNLLFSYWDLSNNLKGLYNISDLEFIIAALFYYKRLSDLKNIDKISGNEFLYRFNNDVHYNFNYYQSNESRHLDSKIFEDLRGLLEINSLSKIDKLLKPLSEFNTRDFKDEEFGKAFEYILEINNGESLKTRLIRTPRPIIELMSKILDPKKGRLYDPVCGTGGFLTEAFRISKEIEIYGSEINYRIAQISFMNQIMNGDLSSSINAENCFEQLHNDRKYDYIIGDLPMEGISVNDFIEFLHLIDYNFPKRAKSFGAFILFSISKLSEKGKAVFTVSESFLFKTGVDEQIRNILIKNDFIEAVISLPNGALKPYTNGKASILVLNKSKTLNQKGKIKFINLPENTNYVGIDVNEILEFYFEEFINNPFVQVVQIDHLLELNNLSPAKYTNELIEVRKLLLSGNAMYLHDLMILISGTAPIDKEDVNKSDGIPFVKIENLERNILDVYLSKVNIKDYIESDNPKYEKYIIEKECLIIAKIGDNIKPTYFKPTKGFERIILHSNVIALFPRSNNKISLEFLYYQFYSDFLINQIEKKLSKSIMPFLTIPSIKELIIPILDLVSQNNFIEFHKANSIAAERARVDERFKKIGYIEDAQERELNIVRTLTHQLRHNLTSIATIVDKANRIVSKNNLSEFTQYHKNDPILIPKKGFEVPENMYLGEILEISLKKAQTLNSILLDVEKAINLDLQYSRIDFKNLLNEIKNDYRNENFSIEIVGDEIMIELSKTHIEDLINTLILNAKEHSFKKPSNNKISFNVTTDINRAIVTFDYKCNGLPLTITEKEYKSILTKSRDSNGTGIGGYYINKIVEAHKGSLKVDENFKKGVHIIIELPLKHTENE
ncbi:N-6 DNA methylase [Flavobacterium sp. ANB]|uniref:N-6 DNA methylase n=1 Tax=unclassified Flavobacterium TaxID=196869 RepID=UPI0012B6D812|nr:MULTISPECIES: N-6 DNA methylase [unclassified Flavobacterium]MBF4516373.1 N-6 DNA methylase [Flavobacterium sp. ANB]MTD69730.1 N-6 DNA methylase [Flavobacterium sp. LC2016-13]